MNAIPEEGTEVVMASIRVLVIDDDIAVTRILTRTFERAGCSVRAVHNGEQAIAALSEAEFDAMICDIQMPRMGGRDLCRHLTIQGPYIPRCVFIVTSRTESEERDWIGEYPGAELIEKPVSPKQVLRRMSRALSAVDRESDSDRRAA